MPNLNKSQIGLMEKNIEIEMVIDIYITTILFDIEKIKDQN